MSVPKLPQRPTGSGGARNKAGRKKGIPNKKTIEFERYCLEALKRAVPKNGELGALQFFQALYRDDKVPLNVRSDAASRALPYESPRLASTEFSGGADPIKVQMMNARDSIKRRLAQAAVQVGP